MSSSSPQSWNGLLARLLLLAVVAAGAGAAANAVGPRRIPWRQDWSHHVESKAIEAGLALATLDDVQRMVATGTHLLLDARSLRDYDAGHIPGAWSLPNEDRETSFASLQGLFNPAQPILIYCSGKECDESFHLCLFFKQQGLTNVALYVGGYLEWSAAARRTP
jgi:rhodanese-related sulfurtransferase